MSKSSVLYYTLAGEYRAELIIKGSRFIATAVPVVRKEDALVHIERVRQEFPGATHHCFAYRLGKDGLDFRTFDDGEPRGSAGKPILFVLQKYRLSDALVVVTRYFGGIKLGIGPLARAYAQVTEKALLAAERVPVMPYVEARIYCTYDDLQSVLQLLRRDAISFDADYRDAVEITARIRSDTFESFSRELSEVTAGRAGVVVLAQP